MLIFANTILTFIDSSTYDVIIKTEKPFGYFFMSGPYIFILYLLLGFIATVILSNIVALFSYWFLKIRRRTLEKRAQAQGNKA